LSLKLSLKGLNIRDAVFLLAAEWPGQAWSGPAMTMGDRDDGDDRDDGTMGLTGTMGAAAAFCENRRGVYGRH
jgi:hypothetical protein